MKIINYKMTKQVEKNLKGLISDKIKLAELEESLKIEFLHGTIEDPRNWDVEIKYNKTANCYDVHLKRIERPE